MFPYQDHSFDQDPIKGTVTSASQHDPNSLDTRSGRTYRGMRAPTAGSRGNSRFRRRSWLLPCSIPDPASPPPLAGTEQIKSSATNPTRKESNAKGNSAGPSDRWEPGGEIPKGMMRRRDGKFRSPSCLAAVPGIKKKKVAAEMCLRHGVISLDELPYEMTVLPFGWWQTGLMQQLSWMDPWRGGFTPCAAGCQMFRYRSEHAVASLCSLQLLMDQIQLWNDIIQY